MPQLADYAEWIAATVSFEARDFDGAIAHCEELLKNESSARQTAGRRQCAACGLKSPMAGAAAVLAARAYVGAGKAGKAVEILRRFEQDLPQPEGYAALAGAYDAVDDTASAAAYDQRVWLNWPLSPEAQGADAELRKRRQKLGPSYPEPPVEARLQRAAVLMDARLFERARRELTDISQLASGPAREIALVRIGEAMSRSRKDATGLAYLEALRVSSAEAGAERLYQMVAAARRLDRVETMVAALDQLAGKHPKSQWRLQALVSAGNEYLLLNQPDKYEPAFRACYSAFPKSAQAPYCHWKVAFLAYLENRKDADELLKAHLRDFPESEKSSAALYFLGRMAERSSAPGDARAWYDQLLRSFPNFYYGTLARERRVRKDVASATPSQAVVVYLRNIRFPGRPLPSKFEPSPTDEPRFERARLLRTAALDELAEAELRFAAKDNEQTEAIGLELARIASARQAVPQAVRYLKRYAGGYLYSPVESVPKEFWTLAFPLPWRQTLFQYSRQAGIDPYMVAALIRQESEFDPRAISSANAYGLTQILPSTGRELSRRMKIRGFNASMLLRPEFNLRLGTQYLKSQLNGFSGRWELTLAAYNAGKSRVIEWLKRGEFQEPAEFVEAIPFSETRNYVQVVIRNADLYRRVYK